MKGVAMLEKARLIELHKLLEEVTEEVKNACPLTAWRIACVSHDAKQARRAGNMRDYRALLIKGHKLAANVLPN